MKIMSDNSELTFSNFGIYDLDDQIELILPNTLIKLHRISENAFSYYRKNSEGNVVEKIIPIKSQDVKIELAPIRPLNYPARRTNHVLLQFDKEIYLSENSAASIFVNCPIEIGIFLIHNSNHSSDPNLNHPQRKKFPEICHQFYIQTLILYMRLHLKL